MVQNLEINKTTQERFIDELSEHIERYISDVYHVPDIEINSPKIAIPDIYENPVFNIRIQELVRTRGLPVLEIRLYIYVALKRTQGEDSGYSYNKVMRESSKIIELLNVSHQNLQYRTFRVVNQNNQFRDETHINLIQCQFSLFQQQGEHNIL
jgi:hypothetical protein